MNRRTFVTAVSAGALALRRPAMAAKARFELGIGTYTYRGLSLDRMIEDLNALKIRQVEISSPDYFLPNVKPENVPALRARLQRAGITPVSYFCGDIKTQADL